MKFSDLKNKVQIIFSSVQRYIYIEITTGAAHLTLSSQMKIDGSVINSHLLLFIVNILHKLWTTVMNGFFKIASQSQLILSRGKFVLFFFCF